MPTAEIHGATLSYELTGAGQTSLVLVHGAWVSRGSWDPVVPALARSRRVLTYDRRGHGDSHRPPGTASIAQHAADLGALIEHLELAPAWVAGNSSGAAVALRLAMDRPDLFRGLIGHEPPLFSLLRGDPSSAAWLAAVERCLDLVVEKIRRKDHAEAARLFMETVTLGPGSWEQISPRARRLVTAHAPAFLDEATGPERLAFDPEPLRAFDRPVLLTQGGRSPPAFARVLARLAAEMPGVLRHTFAASGHIPHRTHPEEYVDALERFMAGEEPGGSGHAGRLE